MATVTRRVAARPRDYVRVAGPDAEDFLQRMLSNDVDRGALPARMLLTPKARLIAPLVVVRRADEDFLLLTEPGLGEIVGATLLRARFAAKVEIEPEEHTSVVVFGEDGGIPNERARRARLRAARRRRRRRRSRPTRSSASGSSPRAPAWGKELDDTILPAEAGLDETHVSFTKGCYPGQEPIARLHYRGKVNREPAGARGRGRRAGRRDPPRRKGRRPGHERSRRPGARLRTSRGSRGRRAERRGGTPKPLGCSLRRNYAMGRIRGVVVIAALFLLFVAAGCGGNSGGSSESEQATTTNIGGTQAESHGTKDVSDRVRQGRDRALRQLLRADGPEGQARSEGRARAQERGQGRAHLHAGRAERRQGDPARRRDGSAGHVPAERRAEVRVQVPPERRHDRRAPGVRLLLVLLDDDLEVLVRAWRPARKISR